MKTYIELDINNEQMIQLSKLAGLEGCSTSDMTGAIAQVAFEKTLNTVYQRALKVHHAAPEPIRWEAAT